MNLGGTLDIKIKNKTSDIVNEWLVGHRNHIKQPAGGGSVGGDC